MCGQISDLEIVYCGDSRTRTLIVVHATGELFVNRIRYFSLARVPGSQVEKRSCHRPVTGDGTDQEPVVSRSNPPFATTSLYSGAMDVLRSRPAHKVHTWGCSPGRLTLFT